MINNAMNMMHPDWMDCSLYEGEEVKRQQFICRTAERELSSVKAVSPQNIEDKGMPKDLFVFGCVPHDHIQCYFHAKRRHCSGHLFPQQAGSIATHVSTKFKSVVEEDSYIVLL